MPPKKLTKEELARVMRAYDPSKPQPKPKLIVLPKGSPQKAIKVQVPRATGPVLNKSERVMYLNLKANYMHKLGNENAARKKANEAIIASRAALKASPVPIQTIKKSPVVLAGSPLQVFKSGTPKRRLRIGSRIAEGYSREQLMNVYKKKGIVHGKYMTKRQLIDLIKHKAVTPVLKPVHNKTKMTRAEKLLAQVEKFKSLQSRTKKNIKEYANRHAISGVSMRQLKGDMIATIQAKLVKNVKTVLASSNKSKVTMRMIIDRLIKEHGWHSNRNLNKKAIMKVYENSLTPRA